MRTTPRTWQEQGQPNRVTIAPTRFGPMAYEIVSDVEHEASWRWKWAECSHSYLAAG